jgi:nicotinamide-nucleotide amidase
MGEKGHAAIVTVGSELTYGLRLDTNTRDIASRLSRLGYTVAEAVSVADDLHALATTLKRLCAAYPLVVTTGGLGPTHDDLTREAAAKSLDLPLERDPKLMRWLESVAARHALGKASEQVFRQAEVIQGARVIRPTIGTASGQVVPTSAGKLVLLPGPPQEMSPMLDEIFGDAERSSTRILRCAGITESDAQVAVQEVLEEHPDISLTVLASPSLVDVVLVEHGHGDDIADAAVDAAAALGSHVYASDGRSLAEVVLDDAAQLGVTIATAESCTGGMLSAALTDVPGSSRVVRGGVVTYSNELKMSLLGVRQALLEQNGAVSASVAEAMAAGAAETLGADLTLSVTGVAGPEGGTDEKPVGLVWFGVAYRGETSSFSRRLPGDRAGVRTRAVVAALDAARKALGG